MKVPKDRQPLAPLGWRECLIVAGSFLASTLVLTLPLVTHVTRTLPSDLVDTLLNAWILGWDADRLAHGLRAVWDAPIFFPYHDTLAFSENLFGLGFLVAPVYWITGNPILTYNVGFLLSFVVAGIGMYLLARNLTGSRSAAAVAGAAYAFCPFRMAQIAHVQMVATGWLPIALWGLHQYFDDRRKRWLAVFAAAAILQATSNTYVAYFMGVPFLIVMADGLIRAPGTRLKTAAHLTMACLAVAAVLAPVGAAYYRARSVYEQVRRPEEIANGGADLRAYLVGKNSIGVWRWLPTAVATDPEKELFPGVFAVTLGAMAYFAAPSRRRTVRLYAWIAAAGLLFSLGPSVRVWGVLMTAHGPYEWLLRLVPGMNGMRVPARFAIVFVAGLSILAGFGASAILDRLRPGFRPLALAVCLAAIVADSWAVPLPTVDYSARGRPEDRAIALWLNASPPGAVLHLPIRTNNFQEVSYEYATLFHPRHPIVNGFSGYNTPLQESLGAASSPLADERRLPDGVRQLRAMGVRYVIVHDEGFTGPPGPASITEALRNSGQITRESRFLDVTAFELSP